MILTLAIDSGAITVFHGQGYFFINDSLDVYDRFLGLIFSPFGYYMDKIL